MQKEYQLAVDIEKKILTPSFEVNTLDLKTIKLKITITKGMTLVDLTDITVRMSIRKPDGNVLFQDCKVVNAKNGQVEIILENQAYIIPGSYSAEIMCFKGTDKVAVTGSFSYRSIKGIMDDKAVESKSEFTAITRQLDDVQTTVNDLRENGTGIDAQARQDVLRVAEEVTDVKNRIIDVKDYGAKGDWNGSTGTDDTAAIQAAIQAAGSDHEVVFSKGNYYISKTVTFKDHAKLRFEGAKIITNRNFTGVAAFHCNSADINDGKGKGYLLFASILSVDNATNAIGILITYCKNFHIHKPTVKGFLKGGIKQIAGYEFFLYGHDIEAPDVPTANLEPLTPGLDMMSNDGEVLGGVTMGYPVGTKTNSLNNFVNVHNWGMPNTETSRNKIMLYPFLITGKNNTFTNCYADTPELLDTTGIAGGQNGGMGFFEAHTSLIPDAYPMENSYVNCKVRIHRYTLTNKIIGFKLGDSAHLSGINSIGINTRIISPMFTKSGTVEYLKKIEVENSKRIRNTVVIIDPDSRSNLGAQSSVTTSKLNVKKEMDNAFDTSFYTKEYKIFQITNVEKKLFSLSEVEFFTINQISLARAQTDYGTEVQMTTDGTNHATKTFYDSAVVLDTDYQIALTRRQNQYNANIYIVKRSDGWYIKNNTTVHNLDMFLDITVKYV